MNVRTEIYRWLGKVAFSIPGVDPWLDKRDQPISGFPTVFWRGASFSSQSIVLGKPALAGKFAWFHAASAGELEALWPIIQQWTSDRARSAVVTIFSGSAERALVRLDSELRNVGASLCGVAYSPREGQWKEALARVSPDVFVTFKYEAWPDLWASLAELDIPLVVIGARDRASLKVGKLAMGALGSPMPKTLLLSSAAEELESLKKSFPEATVEWVGEPRWDRVAERARLGSVRAQELIAAASGASRPWGVLGSAWLEDIRILGEQLANLPGKLWVVPHDVSAASIAAIEVELSKFGLRSTRTSRMSAGELQPKGCLLVDEVGVLAELYSAMDWVYVGGGFNKGIHSTIEPALYGLPIAVGPRNAEKFSEIFEMERTGQLQIFRDELQVVHWFNEIKEGSNSLERRIQWKSDAAKRLGASERTLKHLLKSLE
jgi:3-deoxy-D-manno-octulosonic-acid transferase